MTSPISTPADGLLEGLTADSFNERRSPMSDSAYPAMRREIQDYLRSCERLLAAALPTQPSSVL
jgi:hypothetical protein